MTNLGHQSGSNEWAQVVNSRYEASLDDIATHIRKVRESKVEDWTRVKNFRALSVPKNLKVKITCMFLRGAPAMWFEVAHSPLLYTRNKFRSSIQRNFESLGADWERRIVKKFGNSTNDSSKGHFSHDEGACPFNVPVRNARNDDSNDSGDNEGDYEEES